MLMMIRTIIIKMKLEYTNSNNTSSFDTNTTTNNNNNINNPSIHPSIMAPVPIIIIIAPPTISATRKPQTKI